MYIVTKDNPYYPGVEYFETIEEANTKRDEWLAKLATDDGEYECKVTVARIIETKAFKSDY